MVDRPTARRYIAIDAGRPADGLAAWYAEAWGRASDVPARTLRVRPSRRPERGDREGRSVDDAFAATPGCLVRSWRVARQIATAGRAGDVFVVSDEAGIGAVAALDVWHSVLEHRIVIIAGASSFLRYIDLAGTDGPFEEADVDDTIDLERTAYAHASAVVTPSRWAAEMLERTLGVEADVSTWLDEVEDASPAHAGPFDRWVLPEPVSRRAATADIVRAAAGSEPQPHIELTEESEPDPFWQGSTASAFAGVLASLLPGPEADRDGGPTLVVRGDRLGLPGVRTGPSGAVVVRRGSMTAGACPGLPTWEGPQDLIDMQSGRAPRAAPQLPVRPPPIAPTERVQLPSITCVVPLFRDVRFLESCVRSILGQTIAPARVLLVDDGSADPDVEDAVARIATDPLVDTIRLPINQGVCVARNVGLEAVDTEAIFFVDQDDELEPDALERCARVLARRPDLAAVATWTRFFGSYEAIEAMPAFDRRAGWRHNTIVSTAALVRASFLRTHGVRFEPTLAWVYCEDWDLWAQLVGAGGRIGLVPRPLVHHRVHPASGGHARRPLALGAGRAWVRRRFGPLGGSVSAPEVSE